MAYAVTYDVHAAVTPTGQVEWCNTLHRKVFSTINTVYSDHKAWRWLIVNRTGLDIILVVDLWKTELTDNFPYVAPSFIHPSFDNVDQAIGYVCLNLC